MKPGDDIRIEALRSNGSCYRWWTARVEALIPGGVVTLAQAGSTVYEKDGPRPASRHVRSYYWFDRAHNLNEFFAPDGRFEMLYAHIASVPVADGGFLAYVDHELDIVRRPGQDPRLVDEAEFSEAVRIYGYSPEFEQRCRAEAARALELVRDWKLPDRLV
jgi:protein associated with RNAse G/E